MLKVTLFFAVAFISVSVPYAVDAATTIDSSGKSIYISR